MQLCIVPQQQGVRRSKRRGKGDRNDLTCGYGAIFHFTIDSPHMDTQCRLPLLALSKFGLMPLSDFQFATKKRNVRKTSDILHNLHLFSN